MFETRLRHVTDRVHREIHLCSALIVEKCSYGPGPKYLPIYIHTLNTLVCSKTLICLRDTMFQYQKVGTTQAYLSWEVRLCLAFENLRVQ